MSVVPAVELVDQDVCDDTDAKASHLLTQQRWSTRFGNIATNKYNI